MKVWGLGTVGRNHKREVDPPQSSATVPLSSVVLNLLFIFTLQSLISWTGYKRVVYDYDLYMNYFRCTICDKGFPKQWVYRQHMRIHKKVYECKICKERFTTKHDLTMHRISHKAERPHQCEICTKKFPRKWQLTRHVQSHSRIKPPAVR